MSVPELKNLRAPVLIIHGREDPLPLSVAQEIQQTIPGARLEVIDDCGHYPWLDQPARFFALVKGAAAKALSVDNTPPNSEINGLAGWPLNRSTFCYVMLQP